MATKPSLQKVVGIKTALEASLKVARASRTVDSTIPKKTTTKLKPDQTVYDAKHPSRQLVGWQKPKRADMPIVSVMPKREMRQAIELMEEAAALKQMIRENTLRLEGDKKKGVRGILDDLRDLQVDQGLPGMKYGQLVFVASEQEGKLTMQVDLLLENGCPPEAIPKSYKRGAPFWKKEIIDLNAGEED